MNGQRALRIEPTASIPNLIGGGSANQASPEVKGATIDGGGSNGGGPNEVTDDFGFVGGGTSNVAGDASGTTTDAEGATVGGGFANVAKGIFATTAGGHDNSALGAHAAIGGGLVNLATGSDAAIPGGSFNTAAGNDSFAGGAFAGALHDGDFVWADSTPNTDFNSTAADQFLVRAAGGAKIVRGASSFSPVSQAALQVEQNDAGDSVGWFRMVNGANTHSVLSAIKQSTGTGNFLQCFDQTDATHFTSKCHIDKDGTWVSGSDFAESLRARGGKAEYQPGDVLSMSVAHPGQVVKSRTARDRALIGVYSPRPGVLGADKGGITRVGKEDVPVAITGIVPVKVTAQNGAIRPGDLLTSSNVPGRAMNAGLNPRIGTVLGKALGALSHGNGTIRMLVMLR